MSWIWEEHPSKKIIGEHGKELEGKRLVLGVTSSVSLYKSIDVARAIMKNGGNVTVVMSEEATRLVNPTLFEWATGNKVFHTRFGGEGGHILLAETHDAMAIVPSTANTLAKLAYGIGDTPVVLTALSMLGSNKPVLVLPTMHKQLYDSPQNREVIKKLTEQGVIIHKPKFEGDKAKFPEPWEVVWHLTALLARGKDLKGLKVLVTAGATREYFDPIRFISNPSTGKMGVAIAMEAHYRGAEVSLVHGPLCNVSHSIERSVEVETTDEMLNAVVSEMRIFDPDIIVLAAAPVDFKPVMREPTKIKSDTPPTVSFTITRKIIEEVTLRRKDKTVLVGFAAETVEEKKDLVAYALQKKEKYNLDIIVANNVGRKDIGFASEENEVIIIRDNKQYEIPKTKKEVIARRILDVAGEVAREKMR